MVIIERVKFFQRCCLQMPPCIPFYGLSVHRWALSSGRMPSAPAQFYYCYFSPDHLWLWSELIIQGTWELVYHPLSSFSCSLNPFANLPNNIYISYQNYKTRPLMYIYDSIVNKYWCGYGVILCAGGVGSVIFMSSFQASDHSRKIQVDLISSFKLYHYT